MFVSEMWRLRTGHWDMAPWIGFLRNPHSYAIMVPSKPCAFDASAYITEQSTVITFPIAYQTAYSISLCLSPYIYMYLSNTPPPVQHASDCNATKTTYACIT